MLFALALSVSFAAALLPTIDYPIGTAFDEHGKLGAVRTGNYHYYHPLLIVDLGQAAAFVVQPPDLPSLAHLVRMLSVVAGGVLVFATFILARLLLPDLPSLAAAAAAAATPLFTVHARLFKEDIFLACFLVLVLAALIRLLQEPTQRRAILLGLLVGLAAGTKYVGVLILPFAVIAILLIPTQGQGQRWARAGTVAATSIVTFLLVMLPAIRRFDLWKSGVNSEFLHAMRGHDVPLPLRVTSGLFHLRESLLPGLGTPLFVLGLIGLAAPLVAARERRMPLLLIASFALLWYAVHETAPLKPFPDFSRYMLPLVPLLVILGTSFVYELSSRVDARGAIAAIAVLLAAIPALSMSLRINSADADPRSIVSSIVAASGERAAFDRYADFPGMRELLGYGLRPTKDHADIAVTSNLAHDRFDFSQPRKGSAAAFYRHLLSQPHLEVSNGRPTSGYFNPVLRIVALDGSVARLQKIAGDIRAAAPGLTVRLVEQPASNVQ
jgi:hypothetical protein